MALVPLPVLDSLSSHRRSVKGAKMENVEDSYGVSFLLVNIKEMGVLGDSVAFSRQRNK